MKSLLSYLLLALLVSVSFYLLFEQGAKEMLIVMGVVVGLLAFFSVVWRVMRVRGGSMAEEIRDRTITWWWMVAVFMLALATHKIVSFTFLGLLCFSALREFFSLLPKEETVEQTGTADGEPKVRLLQFKDPVAVTICYLSIPLIIAVAYVQWYELFIILIPVYLFLLIPILFVVENRTEGGLKSFGVLAIGFLFFVHNLGHCLFMINMGAIVLMFCFTLTEVRDLLSFWLGKSFASLAGRMEDGWLQRLLEWRIAPSVSPKKTWAAGLGSAVIIALAAMAFVPLMPEFPERQLGYGFIVFVGFMVGLLGLFGDLVFSMIKRDIGVKDSGTVLPGHGGVIDRVDSLVFTIPITFHLVYWYCF
ncbi:MAG: phosphatidate cytidylyltransferase [Pirellulales bacterium]|nr:phosphatidate cytidylyltransferase [Pirellulales bacterium]